MVVKGGRYSRHHHIGRGRVEVHLRSRQLQDGRVETRGKRARWGRFEPWWNESSDIHTMVSCASGVGSRVRRTEAEADSDNISGGRNRRECGSGRSTRWRSRRPGLGSHLAVATTGSVNYGIAVMIKPSVGCS